MLTATAGLWIAGESYDDSQVRASAQNLAGICFLPYS
jgi:hypothetical protein